VQPPEPPGDEFALIARFFSELDQGASVVLGNGDDGAILALADHEQLVVSVDTMVQGVHFPVTAGPSQIAYRAVAAATSDLAAMGARPVAMTLALTLSEANEHWLKDFRLGLASAIEDFSLPLVGGDLTRGDLTLAVQVMGAVPAGMGLSRSGARAGDELWVSGCLGDAAAGLAVVLGELSGPQVSQDSLTKKFWRPQPALALGEALRGQATACIDISDGLLADVAHLARASGVRAEVAAGRVPQSSALRALTDEAQALRWALAGGEDYVLCFTLPPGAPAPDGCFPIGQITAGEGVYCDAEVEVYGYRHF